MKERSKKRIRENEVGVEDAGHFSPLLFLQ